MSDARIYQKFEWEETVSWTEPSLTLQWVVVNTEDETEVNYLIENGDETGEPGVPPFVVCAAAETGAGGAGAWIAWPSFQSST